VNLWTAHWKSRALRAEEENQRLREENEKLRKLLESYSSTTFEEAP
jgi:hypothetical protein